MATQFYSTGPCYIQVSTGGTAGSQTLAHLGWSEAGFKITIFGYFEPVMCDIGGNKVGTDYTFQGQDAYITGDINKYDETVMQQWQARCFSNTTGNIATGLIGGLMLASNQAQRLLLVCPYAALTGQTTQQAAFNFPSSWLDDANEIETGTRVKKQRISVHAIPSWSVSSGGLSSAVLYNTSVSGAATID